METTAVAVNVTPEPAAPERKNPWVGITAMVLANICLFVAVITTIPLMLMGGALMEQLSDTSNMQDVGFWAGVVGSVTVIAVLYLINKIARWGVYLALLFAVFGIGLKRGRKIAAWSILPSVAAIIVTLVPMFLVENMMTMVAGWIG